MTKSHLGPTFYIGWDVGEWDCEKNGNCQDDLAATDAGLLPGDVLA